MELEIVIINVNSHLHSKTDNGGQPRKSLRDKKELFAGLTISS